MVSLGECDPFTYIFFLIAGETTKRGPQVRGLPSWTWSMNYTNGPLSCTSRKIFPITDHRVEHYEAEICISQQPQSFKERHISTFIAVIYFTIILVCVGVQTAVKNCDEY